MKKTEDIGAIKTHTVIEKSMKSISLKLDEKKRNQSYCDKRVGFRKLDDIVDTDTKDIYYK